MIDMRMEAEQLLELAPDGAALDGVAAALIDVGVQAVVTALDIAALDAATQQALAIGAEWDEIQEIVTLVSGWGIHSLMATARRLLPPAAETMPALSTPLDEAQRDLWVRYVGEDPYWAGFEAEFPGFLDALLRLSPALFRRFHEYCAVPGEAGCVRAVTKELAAMACDATPTHRFLPGFRLHLRNAQKLGAGRIAVLQALEIAASVPAGW